MHMKMPIRRGKREMPEIDIEQKEKFTFGEQMKLFEMIREHLRSNSLACQTDVKIILKSFYSLNSLSQSFSHIVITLQNNFFLPVPGFPANNTFHALKEEALKPWNTHHN